MLALIRLAQQGDKKARDKILIENTGLIWSIVKRFVGRGHEKEDLFQIGCIGMLKAIDNFNTEFNVVFSTYAVPMITGEIRRFLRDDGIIKISRTIKETQGKIIAVTEDFSNKNGREPGIEEISKILDIEKEDILIAMDASKEVFSIDYKQDSEKDTGVDLLEKIQDNKSMEKGILNKVMVAQLLDSLEIKEKKLILLRYFHDKTQSQTAAILGTSQVQISRMEKKILEKLKKQTESE